MSVDPVTFGRSVNVSGFHWSGVNVGLRHIPDYIRCSAVELMDPLAGEEED